MSLITTLTNRITGRSAKLLLRSAAGASLSYVPEMEVGFARKLIGYPERSDLHVQRTFISRDKDGWPVSVYHAN